MSNFVVSGPKFTGIFCQRDMNRQISFPIFEISIRSGDIRG